MFSDPVTGKAFFDRKPILDLLAKRVGGLKGGYRQNVAIIGCELLGKTSLILQFLSTFKDNQILPIYVDLKDEPFTQFAYRFMEALLYNFLVSKGKASGGQFRELVTNCTEFIPRTVEEIKKIEAHLEKYQFDQAFSLLLDLTAVVKEESRQHPILILDEFDQLGTFKLSKPFAHFGKKIMTQKETMYIIASSSVNLAKEIVREKLSLLFGNFEIVELLPFDFETSRRFLDERLKTVNIPDAYKKFLIALTRGHPFYLDVASHTAMKVASEKNFEVSAQDLIAQALEAELFNLRGTLNQYLSSLLRQLEECRGSDTYLSILLAIAEGSNKLSDIAKFTKKKASDVSKPVAKLTEMDFLQKFGSFYSINDPLLKFWLRAVYQRRKSSVASRILEKSNEFRQDVKNLASHFMDESKRSSLERAMELFRLFKNETVEIGKKRYRLPHFVEVESRIVRDVNLPVVARFGNKYWIAQVEEKRVTETEVAEFAQKCKQSRYKIQRKILIVLNDLEINAKLLAKEEKIWIWGLGELNLLLDLYGKPLLLNNEDSSHS